MKHSKQDLDRLIEKYLSGEATSNEKNQLEQAYMKASSATPHHENTAHIHKIGTESWEALIDRINQSTPKRPVLWPRILTIAAVLAAIVFGIYFFKDLKGTKDPMVQDAAPGTIGATLTLSSGEKISLSGSANEDLKEAGVTISKSENGSLVYKIKGQASGSGKFNTLSTAKGQTYQVHLPDGTLVYLNSASSLTYAVSLTEHGKRMVRLSGEGYFEVFKDKAHPFIVKTEKQEVEVLGTHFNINSYADEPVVSTTLMEGLVKVRSGIKEEIIKPGEQAINSGGNLKVGKVDVDNVIDWKNGDFYLDGVEFKTAMRKIARWYNMEVVYAEVLPDNIRSGGWVSRNNSLSAVLKSIEASGQVHFKIEGKKILIKN